MMLMPDVNRNNNEDIKRFSGLHTSYILIVNTVNLW